MAEKQELFSPEQLTPTKWITAAGKAKFATHFMRFVRKGCPKSLFYEWFYQRLSVCFGHVAHYNKGGFYAEFFETPADRARFLSQTLDYQPVGDPSWAYSDVERAIQDALRAERVYERYVHEDAQAVEAGERAELARLVAKYGSQEPHAR